MRKILFLLLISAGAYSQTPQTSYTVATVSAMKTYFGQANRVHVIATNTDYVICSPCTTDEITIFAGAGGRKWKRQVPQSILDSLNQVIDVLLDENPTNGSNNPTTSNAVFDGLALKAPIASPTFTGTVSGITGAMVGLGNASNTSDANKPVSTAQQAALDLKANLASPTFTGTPTLPTGTIATTQTAANSTTAIATTAFVTTADNLKANLASPALTGTPTAPTATGGTNTTQIATTAFVAAAVSAGTAGVASFNGRTGTVIPVANDYATLTETYTNKTLTAPVLGGTVTGTYTIGGTPTFPSGVTQNTSTQTLTNKRWTPRVGATTSSATPTINTDNVDIYKLTAQTTDITSFTTNLTGTPVDGDVLEIQVTGTGARALTFGSSFVASTVSLPTTTVSTATLTIIFQYFTTSSYGNNKWVCVNTF